MEKYLTFNEVETRDVQASAETITTVNVESGNEIFGKYVVWKNILKDVIGKRIVKEHLTEGSKFYFEHASPELAEAAERHENFERKLTAMFGLDETEVRRRLTEVPVHVAYLIGYHALIGFQIFLMFCLVAGIYFAYHVGSSKRQCQQRPVRW